MNSNAIYIIGNGKMAAALQNGDYVQVFGPPYSSPSLFCSDLQLPETIIRGIPSHMPRSGIWQMELQNGKEKVGEITDFALPGEPCIVRHFETQCPIHMHLYPLSGDESYFYRAVRGARAFHSETLEHTDHAAQILLKTKSGNAFQADYPMPFCQYFRLIVRGDVTVEFPEPFTYDICVHGTAELLIIGGPDFPACDLVTQRVAQMPYEVMLSGTKQWWAEQFSEITALSRIPEQMPERERVIQAIEDTVINIVCQQGDEGGVLAGHAYHMGYVRDQYGVCMAMLKLGMLDRARHMLQFYVDVFRHSGKILNAQALGLPGVFHYAENDKTEITGYLLLQFFRYAQAAKDTQLLEENVDFLLWLYEQQVSQLHNGTLPFNGDETYIAGGLLPRDVINDGSAEATMLFLLSGQELLQFLRKNNLTGENTLLPMEQTLGTVQEEYSRHFVVDGTYTLNDPSRTEKLQLPEYRYGVCMNFGAENCEYLGWTKRTDCDVYLCPACMQKEQKPNKKNGRYHLPSALLMPAYLGSDLLNPEQTRAYLLELVDRIQRDGYVYSNETYKMNVGYDYGLLLYNLVVHNLPGKEIVCRKLLSLLDEAGSWAEYYQEGKPVGTRYRAWESSINVDALMTYAQSL